MLASRKPLAILLAVVMIFTMLVPAAMAAPEWVHGIEITSPTTAAPAYVNHDDTPENNYFWIKYNLNIVGIQVDNVTVKFKILSDYRITDNYENVMQEWAIEIPNQELKAGVNELEYKFWVLEDQWADVDIADGWYHVKVCAVDQDPDRDPFCQVQANALLLQSNGPTVDLEKPGVEEYQGATFVTGKAYLMVGSAWDDWGVKRVEFQYCEFWNNPQHCWKNDPGWRKVADGVKTPNVPNQWQATWDTTLVPDDFAVIRMCVWNYVGLSNCTTGPDDWVGRPDAHKVLVTNRFVIELQPGWNLISLPAMPYDSDIESVLFHLLDKKLVKQVVTFVPKAGGGVKQLLWTPDYVGGPQEFSTMRDGQGYWIEMATDEDLTVVGTYLAFPPYTPPEYPVNAGWNLIGYTHFGRPWWFGETSAFDYLGNFNALHAQALWAYDAVSEVFWQQQMLDPMAKGHGFWLAMDQAGVIRP